MASEAVNGVADVKTEEVDEDVVYAAAEDETVDNEREEIEMETDETGEKKKSTDEKDKTASKQDDKDAAETERVKITANFDLGKFQDVMKLEPFINNCTSFFMRVGKSKSADCRISYENPDYAQDIKALKELQIRGKYLGNLKIHGMPVEPAAQVFVKNIPEDTLDDLLQMLFPEATKITMPKARDGKSKGCAMLVFATKAEAEKCVEENTGIKIEENTLNLEIRVKAASPRRAPRVVRPAAKSKPAATTPATTKDAKPAEKKPETKKSVLKRPAAASATKSRTHHSSKRPKVELRSSHTRHEESRPRRRETEPRPEVVANRMANEMAIKMQQMQERMTERIISQVASKISLQASNSARDQATRRSAGANQAVPRRSLGASQAVPRQATNKGRLSDSSSLNCYVCGELGHYARDCTAQECYRCGGIGHYARDCTTTLTSGSVPESRVAATRQQRRDDTQIQGQRSQIGMGQSGQSRGQMVMSHNNTTNGMYAGSTRSSDAYARQLAQQQQHQQQQQQQHMNYYY